MAIRKGTIARFAGAVGNAVQSVAAGVGLANSPAAEPGPESKSQRKAGRKVTIARETKARKVRAKR